MKPATAKREFITRRAEGQSYSTIAKALNISKATCTAWEKELSEQIDDLKRAELAELCESYGMGKEARIKRLGGTLDKINEALDAVDLSEMDPAKLLDYKLKYMEALKGEYTSIRPAAFKGKDITPEEIIKALGDLLDRARAGDISTEQAEKETRILTQLTKAYDTAELQTKLDGLEAMLEGRITK